MYYEVEIEMTATITVEANSPEQAQDIAVEATNDPRLSEELENSITTTVTDKLDNNNYYTYFVDNSGTVHIMR